MDRDDEVYVISMKQDNDRRLYFKLRDNVGIAWVYRPEAATKYRSRVLAHNEARQHLPHMQRYRLLDTFTLEEAKLMQIVDEIT